MPAANPQRAKAIYKMYKAGHSVDEIAKAYGCKFQSIYAILKRHGYAVRKKSKPLPFVLFQGRKYTRRTTGYYACTAIPRTLLHHAVWEFHKGPIPDGFEIHHKDENPANNQIDNLKIKKHAPHARHHMNKRRANGFRPSSEWKLGESPRKLSAKS